MTKHGVWLVGILAACTSTTSTLDEYEQVESSTELTAPAANVDEAAVKHGRYLVELLGCASCHTDGALVGAPDQSRWLAGSSIGIAYTNPLDDPRPGVVFPKNLTPDTETGIGSWRDVEIKAAIVHGRNRVGERNIGVMPWRSFARLSGSDLDAITQYLRSLEPVRHDVPSNVLPGERSPAPFVHFGVYQSRDITE
ncbi:MAG: cytochrome C [Pseudomonadota bacterium]